MKLPRLVSDEHTAHFVILLLTITNTFLIVALFFFLAPDVQKTLRLPKIIPLSAQTPIVDFNLISPQPNSTVAGTVPMITTLTNGPKITAAQLYVDGQRVQAVTSQKTNQLTLFWNTTKHTDGLHNVEIKVTDDQNTLSSLSTTLIVQNNAQRNVNKK